MLQLRRRRWIVAAVLALTGASALAQTYPSKPIRLVVGFTPGGGVDINARLLAPKLTEFLGQPVIVENRPGAGTNIANELVAKAAPDGYTLLINTPAVAINMALYRKLPYDTLRDLVAVSIFSEAPNILVVHNGVPARDAKELVALARAKPGVLNYSSAGSGTTQHLAGELFKLRTGTEHRPRAVQGHRAVAHRARRRRGRHDLRQHPGHPPARQGRAAAAARVDRHEARRTDARRADDEGGGRRRGGHGLVRRCSRRRRRRARSSARSRTRSSKIARSPDISQRLLDQGAEPVGSTPEEFGRVLRAEVAKWTRR